jgi:hypothetical protein
MKSSTKRDWVVSRISVAIQIVFNESPESANGIPIWMECVIYRKDRSFPVVVREYFEEVKGEQAIWGKMPRRMLRHRVMAQCARLAII